MHSRNTPLLERVPRAETVVEMAALAAQLPDRSVHGLHGLLREPPRRKALRELLMRWPQLPPHEQDAVVCELAKLCEPALRVI